MKEESVKFKGPLKILLGAILNLCSMEKPLVTVAQWETKIDDKLVRLEFISIINNNQISPERRVWSAGHTGNTSFVSIFLKSRFCGSALDSQQKQDSLFENQVTEKQERRLTNGHNINKKVV
jgi:hypothetical protein